ncbi:MAG: phosphoribosylglycinamide synthetase C domain-containing protein, partial [Gammaproteobacteria bacterium]
RRHDDPQGRARVPLGLDLVQAPLHRRLAQIDQIGTQPHHDGLGLRVAEAAVEGRLDQIQAQWDPRPALGIVMAAGGYPGQYRKGDIISGLPTHEEADTKVFHAGTAQQDGRIVTAGGRVLCACALGDSVYQAKLRAYELVHQIRWDNVYYRSDIGYRAIAREQQR